MRHATPPGLGEEGQQPHLDATGIQAANPYLAIIFGGKELHPALSGTSILYALAIVGLIGIVSSLYPVSVALKIRPVKAIQTD